MDLKRVGTWACVVVVLSAMAAGICYGLWWAVVQVEHGILAACTLVLMLAVPLAALTGYKLGGTEARGVLQGIGLGTGPVVQTAEKIATVKAGAVQKMKEPDPVIVELPRMRMIDVTPRQLPSGDDQVVM